MVGTSADDSGVLNDWMCHHNHYGICINEVKEESDATV